MNNIKKLASQSNQELLQQKRDGITKKLSRKYKTIKHNATPDSKLLFGDDLNNRIKLQASNNTCKINIASNNSIYYQTQVPAQKLGNLVRDIHMKLKNVIQTSTSKAASFQASNIFWKIEEEIHGTDNCRKRRFFLLSILTILKYRNYRMILNLKKPNKYIENKHFKTNSLQNVFHMVKPVSWMASVDLKDAYYSVTIL